MDFTKSFVRAKNPCADGFRWYLRHHQDGSDYQQVLDDLVRDGRVQDACWLLDQLGPTHTLLQLDRIDCDALVFAGSIEVRGGIESASVLRAGGSIRCGGMLRVGGAVVAGQDVKADGGLRTCGDLRCGGALLAGWHTSIAGSLSAGELKVRGDLRCSGSLAVERAARIDGDLLVEGEGAARSLWSRGSVHATGTLRVAQGLICGADVECGGHLDAGWGIKAGGDVIAAGAIRAGEGIAAAGDIRAGQGYGIFAGLCVQREAWDSSARVTAQAEPKGLMSGFWTGAEAGPASRPGDTVVAEVLHAN